jgi:tetratricopeptide (TPR) repeat protein
VAGWRRNLEVAESLGCSRDALQLERELTEAQCGALRLAEPKLLAYLDNGHPEQEVIFEALVKGYLENYRLKDAVRCAARWKHQDPRNWQPFFYCGRAFELHKAFEKAVEQYRAAYSLNPDAAQVSLSLAKLLSFEGKFQAAMDLFQARAKDERTDTEALLGVAYCQRALGGGEAALAALDRVLDRDRRHPGAVFLRGQVELDLGQPAKAIAWLESAMELRPNDPETVFMLSRCLRLLGRDDESRSYQEEWKRVKGEMQRLNDVREKIAAEPDNLSLRHDAGKILQGLGKYKEAVRWYQTIFQIDPGHRPTHESLAICFDQLGDPARAKYHRDAASNDLTTKPDSGEASEAQVHQFCGACHAYPPAETFPRPAWRTEVLRGFRFFESSTDRNIELLPQRMAIPSIESVVRYYERRAPAALPPVKQEATARPLPVRFTRGDLRCPDELPSPAVSNVNLVQLTDDHRLDLVVSEMRSGRVWSMKPYEGAPSWRLLGKVRHPAHAEVVDLDGDLIKDIIVANLGSFAPTDHKVGSVVWLRGNREGGYTPLTLLEGVGRVADVQAADFNGDGKLDLVAGVFGWQTVGEVHYLENRTSDWSTPQFVPHVLDERHGVIAVPVCDLNKDGRPDFVALIGQEHEAVVAFLNEGGGRFRKQTIYAAAHPAFASIGIQLVDLDGNGTLDVLLANGDVLDEPYLLKPYHGVTWLENQGKFPFTPHRLSSMYGVSRAVAGDVDGDGLLDVVAVSFLPPEGFPQRQEMGLDSIIVLRQTAPGKFDRYPLESVACDHVTCALGDWDKDGRVDLVTGDFCLTERHEIPHSITLWKNLGRPYPHLGGTARVSALVRAPRRKGVKHVEDLEPVSLSPRHTDSSSISIPIILPTDR